MLRISLASIRGIAREWYDGIPDVPDRWIDNVPLDIAQILRHGYYAATHMLMLKWEKF